ncbi:hypothetical protein FRB98_006647 [Tulasnella sp. 332]|nr:hypothetical protein FRB98_006647 [Tulasnella sp. 332]
MKVSPICNPHSTNLTMDEGGRAWAAVHDYCRKNKILIEKTDISLGTPESPSFAMFLTFAGYNFVGGPAPNKKAALRAAAIQAAQTLGLMAIPSPRLHAIHVMLAFVAVMTCLPASETLKPYNYTPLPPSPALEVDYARLEHIAPAVITLETLSAFAFFIIIFTNAYQKRALPVVFELFGGVFCFALELGELYFELHRGTEDRRKMQHPPSMITASIVLIFSAKPIHLGTLRGGSTGGVIGSAGKLGTLDAAATILTEWELSAMFSVTAIILLGLHMLWQLVVSIRHIRTRPRVFLEAVPSDLAWNLSPANELPMFKPDPITVSFEGIGTERAKEWIQTGMRPPGL